MLILPFTHHEDLFDAGQDRLCPSKRFESQHGATPTFDISVILLNQVIQILVLSDSNGFVFWLVGVECGQSGHVGATFINGHYLRFALVSNGLAKEAPRRCSIPFGGQQAGRKEQKDAQACYSVPFSPLGLNNGTGYTG